MYSIANSQPDDNSKTSSDNAPSNSDLQPLQPYNSDTKVDRYIKEWQASGIAIELIDSNLNVLTPFDTSSHWNEGDDEHWVVSALLGDPDRKNNGQLTDKYLRKYNAIASGGWYIRTRNPDTWEYSNWFQIKLNTPREYFDRDKGQTKTIKYESPRGQAEVIFANVPLTIWARIADRYGLDLPDGLDSLAAEEVYRAFWDWVVDFNLPITLAEGGKKTLCLLSHGIVTIGLPGVTMGSRRGPDPTKAKQLIPQLKPFTGTGREITICFDEDEKLSTRENVAKARDSLGMTLYNNKCTVAYTNWHPEQGKGIDDVWANSGYDGIDAIYYSRIFKDYYREQYLATKKFTADVHLDQRFIDFSIPAQPSTILVKSGCGTGKTFNLVREIGLNSHRGVLIIGSRNSLLYQLCDKLGATHWNDYKGWDLVKDDNASIAVCINSLANLYDARNDIGEGKIVVVDEICSTIKAALMSKTISNSQVWRILNALIKIVTSAYTVIGMDANLSDLIADRIIEMRKGTHIIKIDNKPQDSGIEIEIYDGTTRTKTDEDGIEYQDVKINDLSILYQRMVEDVQNGRPIFIGTDSQKRGEALEVTLPLMQNVDPDDEINVDKMLEQLKELAIGMKRKWLRIDKKTIDTEEVREFLANPDKWIEKNQPIFVSSSPSVESGLDIAQDYFSNHYLLFYGVVDVDTAEQMMFRVRSKWTKKIVWTKTKSPYSAYFDESCFFPAIIDRELEKQFNGYLDISMCDEDNIRMREAIRQKLHDERIKPWKNLSIKFHATRNYENEFFKSLLIEKLEAKGYKLEKPGLVSLDGAPKKSTAKMTKKVINKAKELIADQNAIDVYNADITGRDGAVVGEVTEPACTIRPAWSKWGQPDPYDQIKVHYEAEIIDKEGNDKIVEKTLSLQGPVGSLNKYKYGDKVYIQHNYGKPYLVGLCTEIDEEADKYPLAENTIVHRNAISTPSGPEHYNSIKDTKNWILDTLPGIRDTEGWKWELVKGIQENYGILDHLKMRYLLKIDGTDISKNETLNTELASMTQTLLVKDGLWLPTRKPKMRYSTYRCLKSVDILGFVSSLDAKGGIEGDDPILAEFCRKLTHHHTTMLGLRRAGYGVTMVNAVLKLVGYKLKSAKIEGERLYYLTNILDETFIDPVMECIERWYETKNKDWTNTTKSPFKVARRDYLEVLENPTNQRLETIQEDGLTRADGILPFLDKSKNNIPDESCSTTSPYYGLEGGDVEVIDATNVPYEDDGGSLWIGVEDELVSVGRGELDRMPNEEHSIEPSGSEAVDSPIDIVVGLRYRDKMGTIVELIKPYQSNDEAWWEFRSSTNPHIPKYMKHSSLVRIVNSGKMEVLSA